MLAYYPELRAIHQHAYNAYDKFGLVSVPLQSIFSVVCSEVGGAVTSTVLTGGRVATYQRFLHASLQQKGFSFVQGRKGVLYVIEPPCCRAFEILQWPDLGYLSLTGPDPKS